MDRSSAGLAYAVISIAASLSAGHPGQSFNQAVDLQKAHAHIQPIVEPNASGDVGLAAG
jgi:hypothetical protein